MNPRNRSCHRPFRWLTVLVCGFLLLTDLPVSYDSVQGVAAAEKVAAKPFRLTLRKRVSSAPKSPLYNAIQEKQQWHPGQTAVIVCDMWDLHHCLNATLRGGEMAPRMNRVLNEARSRGATIIHAPSSCMEPYKDHPGRKRAQAAPAAKNLPTDISKWCYSIPSEEQGEYPIDQTDGGEDDEPEAHRKWAEKLKTMGRNPRAPWKSQTDLLDIHDEDIISDNGIEIWNVMEQRGIKNVILLGVHTNMCVLGRPFGLRQMAKNGKNVVLMRDMTDTMYNPASKPYVSHFTGTDLIIEHIEKWVCPTITSDQVIGGKVFQFKNDHRPHVVIVSAEREYKTETTLPIFALKHLGKEFRVSFVYGNDVNAKQRNNLPGISVLADADLLLVSARRRVLPKAQMEVVRKFIEAGKPVVGIRTANHAFSLRGKEIPVGLADWENFDAEVIGGHYTGHHGEGPKVALEVAKGAAGHPILDKIDLSQWQGQGSLYLVSPLAKSATALLHGTIPGKPTEPIAWVNTNKFGGRVFYTSLGHPDDFKNPATNHLLYQAIRWALDMSADQAASSK